MNTEQRKLLEADVKDLLNQLAIKLKDVEEPSDIEYLEEYIYDDDNEIENPKYGEAFLSCLKNYVGRILEDQDLAIENEKQYYNSNCY